MTSTRTYTNAYVTDARHQHEMSLPFRHFAVSPFRLSAAHQYTTSFGEPLSIKGAVDTDRARTGFIGRETDAEHNLGAFGARLYSSEYGRFMAVDKLWEKYRTLQPYQYAANSPVMAVDRTGLWIRAVNVKAQNAVRNSIPDEFRAFVEFDNGILNVERIKEGARDQDVNSNVAILSRLAEHESTIIVDVASEFDFISNDGALTSIEFSEVEQSTNGKQAWLGQTLLSRSDKQSSGAKINSCFSPDGNIQVIINDKPPKACKPIGVTTAHELYGHARFILLCRQGQAKSAAHGDKQVEQAIIRAENEASK